VPACHCIVMLLCSVDAKLAFQHAVKCPSTAASQQTISFAWLLSIKANRCLLD